VWYLEKFAFEKSFFSLHVVTTPTMHHICGASVVVFTSAKLLPHIWGSMACPIPLIAKRSKRGTRPSGFDSYIVAYEKSWKKK
jgi:hypothetical protein